MRKLVVLESRVYKKLKAGAGQIESCVLSGLHRQMETILNSQRPAHEKMAFYHDALQKSEQLEKKVADGKPQAVEDRILSDFQQQMQSVLKSQKPARQKCYYITRSCADPKYTNKSGALNVSRKRKNLPKKNIKTF